MKFLGKILMGLIAIIVVIIGSIFLMTGGMPKVADDYLAAVKAQDYEKSKSYLSNYIANDAQSLVQYVQDNSMDDMVDTSWSNRAFVNNRGSISGEITTDNSEVINARITFIKELDDWKIYSIQKQVNSAGNTVQQPANAQQVELVQQAMKVFMQSASEKSMGRFYHYLSSMWQSQVTIEKLDEAFSSVLNLKGGYDFFDNIKPVIDSGLIVEKGVLLLSGRLVTDKTVIYFKQKYLYEGTDWKLLAFEYSNKK
ncbi:MAG: hypothetical protein L3J53_00755 [Proteobacteria bacterium]|nr:hypothetical protein [Pseudomonadota bacterium]